MNKSLFNFGKSEPYYKGALNLSNWVPKRHKIPLIYRWKSKTVNFIAYWLIPLFMTITFCSCIIPLNWGVAITISIINAILIIVNHLAIVLKAVQKVSDRFFNFEFYFKSYYSLSTHVQVYYNIFSILALESVFAAFLTLVVNAFISYNMYYRYKYYGY